MAQDISYAESLTKIKKQAFRYYINDKKVLSNNMGNLLNILVLIFRELKRIQISIFKLNP